MGRGSGPPLPSKGGSDTALTVQVAMNDLSPAGPIQAVEILMESPSLAHMSRTHHAVIQRIQVPPRGQGGPQSDPKPPGMEPGVQWGGVSVAPWCDRPAPLELGVPRSGGPRFGAWAALILGLPRAQGVPYGWDSPGLRLPEIGGSQGWGSQDLGAAGAGAPEAGTPRVGGPWGWVLPAPPAPSLPLSLPQALVLEQAAQGSGPPDLRMQYLRQIQANHEVSPPIPSPWGARRGTPTCTPCLTPRPPPADAAEGGADPPGQAAPGRGGG